MENIIALNPDRRTPYQGADVRACGTCAHGVPASRISSRCNATGEVIAYERSNGRACGPKGALWEKRQRIGLIRWVKRLLYGD